MNIRKLVPTRLKVFVQNQLVKAKIKQTLERQCGDRFLTIGTPLHGNIGDQAITVAQQKFLQDHFPNTFIIDIPRYYFERFFDDFVKKIKPKDVIILNGGGYLGTQWIGEEYFVRRLVMACPYNHIVIFPQTIYYEDSHDGAIELDKSESIYGANKNLTLCAREAISLEFMRYHYPNNSVLFTPDIVLYLLNSFTQLPTQRKGALFCFRSDKEKKVGNNAIQSWRAYVHNKGFEIEDTDTVVPYNIFPEMRCEEVQKILDKFSKAEVIITDRLHGMIFAAISKTPCVVLSNSNHKVRGVYEWIRQLPYIKFLENPQDFETSFESLLRDADTNVSVDLKPAFEPLKEYLAWCLEHSAG